MLEDAVDALAEESEDLRVRNERLQAAIDAFQARVPEVTSRDGRIDSERDRDIIEEVQARIQRVRQRHRAQRLQEQEDSQNNGTSGGGHGIR